VLLLEGVDGLLPERPDLLPPLVILRVGVT
jgi:hypothetical protein